MILVTGAAGFIGSRPPTPPMQVMLSAPWSDSLLLQGLRPRTPVLADEPVGAAEMFP